MKTFFTSHTGILVILLGITLILSYIAYNAFLIASGVLLLYLTYALIMTWVEIYRSYKKNKLKKNNFKKEHTRKI